MAFREIRINTPRIILKHFKIAQKYLKYFKVFQNETRGIHP